MTGNTFNSFKAPHNSLRASPFWAWDSLITKKGVKEQISIMKEMGFGGFFIHSRVGMNVPYLSEEWFDRIKDCVSEAKKLGMDAWLYDEDRWPSGFAGGLVTRTNVHYRCSSINWCYLDDKYPSTLPNHEILGYYAVVPVSKKECLGNEGISFGASWSFRTNNNLVSGIKSYRLIKDPAKAKLNKDEVLICMFRMFQEPTSWYNNGTYVDALNKEAVEYFIELTHEKYREKVGKEFAKTIPGIFFDEPNYAGVPWTDGFDKKYKEMFGYDITRELPEVVLNVKGKDFSTCRYNFYKLVTELFVKSFIKTIGDWCEANDIALTGHVLEEDKLWSQTRQVGAAMRSYEYMQIPGIDVLTEKWQVYGTAIQCSSVARQMGRRHRISETYGCTGWDFPAEGHKALSDWQLALGITLRCHHLLWYTMLGENKRDYPASIFYQSPWYKQYKNVEDYYARVGALMYDGKEQIDILLLHSVESMWGVKEIQYTEANWKLEDIFGATRNSLLSANLSFDYGDEDIMARHYRTEKETLHIGKSSYKAVVIPELLTIRSTTLKLLTEFVKKGGSVYYVKKAPKYVDGKPSTKAAEAFKRFTKTTLEKLPEAVGSKHRRISIYDKKGEIPTTLYLINDRDDGTAIFIYNTSTEMVGGRKVEDEPKVRYRTLTYPNAKVALKQKQCGDVYKLNALDGTIAKVAYKYEDGAYHFAAPLHRLASCLYLITETAPAGDICNTAELKECKGTEITLPTDKLEFSADELNAIALDHISEYTVNGETSSKEIFVLDFADHLRTVIGEDKFGGGMCQPWLTRDTPPQKSCTFSADMQFICKDTPAEDCLVAYEQSDKIKVKLNGKAISRKSVGYWIDPCNKQFVIPKEYFVKGKNILTFSGEFNDKWSPTEAMFIQGNFGVNAKGEIVKPVKKLSIGDWSEQGLRQYTGNLTYHIPVPAELNKEGGTYKVKLGKWKGFALRVAVNGGEGSFVPWPPYEAIVELEKGKKNIIDITVYGNRRNLLGPFYFANVSEFSWIGPGQMKTHNTNVREYEPIGLIEPATIVKVK